MFVIYIWERPIDEALSDDCFLEALALYMWKLLQVVDPMIMMLLVLIFGTNCSWSKFRLPCPAAALHRRGQRARKQGLSPTQVRLATWTIKHKTLQSHLISAGLQHDYGPSHWYFAYFKATDPCIRLLRVAYQPVVINSVSSFVQDQMWEENGCSSGIDLLLQTPSFLQPCCLVLAKAKPIEIRGSRSK